MKTFSCDVVPTIPFITLTCPHPVAAWPMGLLTLTLGPAIPNENVDRWTA